MPEDATPDGLNAEEAEHLAGSRGSSGVDRPEQMRLYEELCAVIRGLRKELTPIDIIGAVEAVKAAYLVSIAGSGGLDGERVE